MVETSKPPIASTTGNPFYPYSWKEEPQDQLATFLTWAHSRQQPLDENFLLEFKELVEKLVNLETTPDRLGENGSTQSWLNLTIELLTQERRRVQALYQEFEEQRAWIKSNYSEEEIAAWLNANLPEAYNYASRSGLSGDSAT